MGDTPLTAVIVPAAGRGERLGPGAPKALRTLAGQPILLHAIRNLATARDVDLIVVAVPEESVEESRALLSGIELPLIIVSGGETRQDSVARALLALPPEVDVVLVHDAARPLVPAEVVDRVAAAVRAGSSAVIPVMGVVDTIKEVDDRDVILEIKAVEPIQYPDPALSCVQAPFRECFKGLVDLVNQLPPLIRHIQCLSYQPVFYQLGGCGINQSAQQRSQRIGVIRAA